MQKKRKTLWELIKYQHNMKDKAKETLLFWLAMDKIELKTKNIIM